MARPFGRKKEEPRLKKMEDSIARTPRERRRLEESRQMAMMEKKRRSIPLAVFSWTFQILLVIMFAYVMVYFFGQSRTNVGQSMDMTLAGGDTVLINTMAYQIGGPKRGDIISFKPNGSVSSHSSIRRVIGLPGETIQIIDGLIYIDGQVYLEQKNYPPITNPGMAASPITMEDDEYFVLGDNRNNSDDSRFADMGMVSSDSIEGKVWYIVSPKAHRGFV